VSAATHEFQGAATDLSHALGREIQIAGAQAVGGGCINHGYRLDTDAGPFFLKLNSASHVAMFEAEAAGLEEIAAAGALRVPRPIAWGGDASRAWLLLEFLPLGRASGQGQRELGQRLARMHHHTSERFGWTRDNHIGSTPQRNAPSDDWIAFWRQHRLGVQLELAARNGYRGRLQTDGQLLLGRFAALFEQYHPAPSLLHGDLWGGNAAFTADGEPVTFDPAVYYGDREADVAMTELFGGFSAGFYDGYQEEWPLDPGYRRRRDLYNLYHVLNHLNLFGSGYLGQAQQMLGSLLRQL
jgi:fructosamine-3-kinase